MNIRNASEIEVQEIIYTLRSEHMRWEDIDPDRSRFYVAADDDGNVMGFVRYESGILNALLASLFVYTEYLDQGIEENLVAHIEDVARSNFRRQLVLFSSTAGDFFAGMGFDEVPLGEAMRLIRETPQGRWLEGNSQQLSTEIAWIKNM
ncbi:MAG: GNAT family N-acetyltransferase [Anaerolineae bacterium]